MSQVAIESTTLVQSWKSESTKEKDMLLDAASPSETTLENERNARQAQPEGCVKQAIPLRNRVAVSPCPMWKRSFDVTGSLIALVVLSPLLCAVAVFIKCVSRGPVLYRQQRYGLDGRAFRVWKFRTIQVNNESDQHQSHVADLMASNRPLEKRDHELDVIPGGALFRNFGIDELPQLINVLNGEMSLVGPRPDVVPFHQYCGWHRRRFDVLPGITGLWQVCGKNQTTFAEMMCLDVAYVRRRSLWLDLRIIFLTIPALAWD
jgi:lipopolysaccharide/colanic/teichoic acid biosynthesis glycosyltransferase